MLCHLTVHISVPQRALLYAHCNYYHSRKTVTKMWAKSSNKQTVKGEKNYANFELLLLQKYLYKAGKSGLKPGNTPSSQVLLRYLTWGGRSKNYFFRLYPIWLTTRTIWNPWFNAKSARKQALKFWKKWQICGKISTLRNSNHIHMYICTEYTSITIYTFINTRGQFTFIEQMDI